MGSTMLNESTFLRAKMIPWSILDSRAWTEKEAQEYQRKMGYPPEGYGLYGFAYTEDKNGMFRMSWRCSGSCE